MVPYGGSDAEDEIAISGEFDEYNDPDTSSDALGDGPALGGDETELSTYSPNLSDADVINFTGQSSTALVATDEEVGTSPNPGGAGSAPQQIKSHDRWPEATAAIAPVAQPGTGGAVLAQTFAAPTAAQSNVGTAPLTQTTAKGISLHAGVVLFFILGILGGLIVVNWIEGD